jgi:hypothetical protein
VRRRFCADLKHRVLDVVFFVLAFLYLILYLMLYTTSSTKALGLQPPSGRIVARVKHNLANVAGPAGAVRILRELGIFAEPGRALDFDVSVRVTPGRDGDDGVSLGITAQRNARESRIHAKVGDPGPA